MEHKALANRRKWMYGLESGEFDNFVYLQGGQCAICLKELDLSDSRRIHIDHCHETDEVRGILCVNCNLLLGLAEENPFILLKAISYMQDPPVRQFRRFKKF